MRWLHTFIIKWNQCQSLIIGHYWQLYILRLKTFGISLGCKIVDRIATSHLKNHRPLNLLDGLYIPVNLLWPSLENKQLDSVEKSASSRDECKYIFYSKDLLTENEPFIKKYFSDNENSCINCTMLNAGVIESVLRNMGFNVEVKSICTPTTKFPNKTVYLIKENNQTNEES